MAAVIADWAAHQGEAHGPVLAEYTREAHAALLEFLETLIEPEEIP